MRRFTVLLAVLLTAALLPPLLPGDASGHPDVPNPERVEHLRRETRRASERVDTARARLDAAVAAYEAARDELERVQRRVAETERRYEEARHAYERAREKLNERAARMYRNGTPDLVDALFGIRSFGDFVRVLTFQRTVLVADTHLVREVERLKEASAQALEEMLAEREAQRVQVERMEARQGELMAELERVGSMLEGVRNEIGSELGKFRFPVELPYSYVDTFGAPRPGGRSHQGVDIFAPRGTPLVAVAGGTLNRVGWQRLGGRRLWLTSPDGHEYYYAHLDGFAPGISDGARVEPGQVIGYVGDSGNAAGTPPHLHFEIHAPDGRALNPYPTLREAEQAWRHL